MRLIIFSKDRVMQLDFLLRSLKRVDNKFDIHVLYTGDQDYSLLDYDITLVKETNFKKDLIELIPDGVVGFMTDDDYVFRDCHVPVFPTSYSLRLGKNIKVKAHFDYGFSVDGHFYHAKDLMQPLEDTEFTNPNKLESKVNRTYGHRFRPIQHEKQSSLVGIPNNMVSDTSGCSEMGGDVEELYQRYLKGERIQDMEIKTSDVHKYIEYIIC